MSGMCRSAAVLALFVSAEAQTPTVSTRVEQTSTAKAGYTTYRVTGQFDSTATEVYALFGEAGALLNIPPAFQQAAPFGTDVGPVRQLGTAPQKCRSVQFVLLTNDVALDRPIQRFSR